MQVYSLTDITLTGSAQQVSATSIMCKWYQIQGTSIASTAARAGDANVSATRGNPVSTTVPFLARPWGPLEESYDLANVYVFGAASDKVSVVYAV